MRILITPTHTYALACAKPEQYVRSVVRIARDVAIDASRTREYSATAWFYQNKSTLITNTHVVRVFRLSKIWWKDLTLHQSHVHGRIGRLTRTLARVLKVDATNDVALLKLIRPFNEALVPRIRHKPTKVGERVMGLGYTGGVLHFAVGRIRRKLAVANSQKPPAQTLYLELSYRGYRLAFSKGASGAPIFDCSGNVIATVFAMITKSQESLVDQRIIYTSTRPGLPNVLASPVSVLRQ